ncbi:Clp protease N-terminal domain-containing protein [Streptomyces sp. NPDC051987]|uniref:Clp protease N-terminal domain-containing protein n=1 Tax=Streptomyces sp. NPDC051987 TaxID=3155808 RepID=UPI003412B4E4
MPGGEGGDAVPHVRELGEDRRTGSDRVVTAGAFLGLGHGGERIPWDRAGARPRIPQADPPHLGPRALAETRRAHSRRITPAHLLLALLDCERPDPAAELLAELGIDRTAVRIRIRIRIRQQPDP